MTHQLDPDLDNEAIAKYGREVSGFWLFMECFLNYFDRNGTSMYFSVCRIIRSNNFRKWTLLYGDGELTWGRAFSN